MVYHNRAAKPAPLTVSATIGGLALLSLLLSIIYLAFVSLGLPDGLLGAGWPAMYQQLGVPVSYAGILSMIISIFTILSSLLSDRVTRKFGTGVVTAASVALTAFALLGFSACKSFWLLCLIAIPYGFGAGSVDASLNNYVALHYSSRHMSWLHCMWGVGASVGPSIMGAALAGGGGWAEGYRWVGIIQVTLSILLVFSLPMWKQRPEQTGDEPQMSSPLSLRRVVALPGAKAVMITFFCYCGLENTAGLWASSYLVLTRNIDADTAARFAGLFYLGITVGRGFCGLIANRFSDSAMIRTGQCVMFLGVLTLLLPLGNAAALCGFIIIGLGSAPVYPCIIHSTPSHFGAEKSQALIGIQMASAYSGSLLMPPIYGFLSDFLTPTLLPWYLLSILGLMVLMHEKLLSTVKAGH